MELAVELSGEHETLPRAEARALVEQAGGRVLEADLDRVLLAEGDLDPASLAGRLALAWRVVGAAARVPVDVDAIADAADEIELDGASFAVRCSRLDRSLDPALGQTIERRLGSRLEKQGTVDLEDPDRIVRVLLDREALVGLQLAEVDRSSFEERHVEVRPHHSPITLHPRLARALVNMTRVGPGQRLWDPFVGTGGLALEAAIVGAQTVASDLDPDMVAGTRETLAHYGVVAELHQGDVSEIGQEVGPVDAICTDPPYGRGSTTGREELDSLYERFLACAADVLEPGDRLVCVLPEPDRAMLAPDALARREHHEWYVHASLTRHVFVFERR